ncbi:arsenate reductase [filamentous cyanobacterium CCP5]|nr:arsenate reductase [filamentous cyanobacterium CCP5]
MSLKVYGIPTCGTCNKARKWLESHGIAYEFLDTKTHPPSREQIQSWVASLGTKPLRNTSGQAYRAIDPSDRQAWSEAQWIDAFADNAMLLKRPLFVADGRAIMAGFRGSDAEMLSQLQG